MWVEVTLVRGAGDYEGFLRSHATRDALPRWGSKVLFQAKHVVNVIRRSARIGHDVPVGSA